jgi:hypothetical protein
MLVNSTYFIIVLLFVFILGCHDSRNGSAIKSDDSITVTSDTLQHRKVNLKESIAGEDFPMNEYLTETLIPIRTNFKRINTITNWSSIKESELWESTEGGVAKFYFQNENLEKIVARHYGETFQLLSEYYLLNGELSFVFEKSFRYNRPIFFDSTAMKETNDTEVFDMGKSAIEENRSYFDKGKLLHQINNQDCGSPFADDYLIKEGERIKNDFQKLMALLEKN